MIDHKKQDNPHLATALASPSHSASPFSRRHGHHQRALHALIVPHKFALPARLGALREPAVLLDRLPLLRDKLERLRAVLHRARLDKPAADDEARAANAAPAVHGGDAAAPRVVLEHVEDLADVADGARETPVWDRERVVLHALLVLLVDADAAHVCREVRCVWGELARLGQVDEGAHARAQEQVDLLGAACSRWRPGVLACYEERGRPVGVGEGPLSAGVVLRPCGTREGRPRRHARALHECIGIREIGRAGEHWWWGGSRGGRYLLFRFVGYDRRRGS